jgi:hypothetical protein
MKEEVKEIWRIPTLITVYQSFWLIAFLQKFYKLFQQEKICINSLISENHPEFLFFLNKYYCHILCVF